MLDSSNGVDRMQVAESTLHFAGTDYHCISRGSTHSADRTSAASQRGFTPAANVPHTDQSISVWIGTHSNCGVSLHSVIQPIAHGVAHNHDRCVPPPVCFLGQSWRLEDVHASRRAGTQVMVRLISVAGSLLSKINSRTFSRRSALLPGTIRLPQVRRYQSYAIGALTLLVFCSRVRTCPGGAIHR